MLTLKDPNGFKNTTNVYSIHLALRKALPCQINTGKRKYVNPCLPPLQWRHNGRAGVSNHQLHDCLLNRLFRHRSKKIAKLCVTDLCEGYPSVTSEFPAKLPVTRKMFQFDDAIMLMHMALSTPFEQGYINVHMVTCSNGNIFRVTGHLCGEFTCPRWIPRTKVSDAELWCFLWSASE